MPKSYRLERTELNDQWDNFIRDSEDQSIFVYADYLSHTNCRLGLYNCYNSNELRAVVVLVESSDGQSACLDDLVVYSGICLGSPLSGQNYSQINSERFELVSFIAEELTKLYEKIEFALAPSIVDVRPFDWFNYGSEENRFKFDIRYTSYLYIADMCEISELESVKAYRDASVARRQQIRYAKRDGVSTEEFDNVDLFIDFYRQTMRRQEEILEAPVLARMESLISGLLNANLARMFVSKTKEGNPGNVSVFAHDRNRAYYLFGAGDPDYRNTPTGTAVIWDSLIELARDGVEQIDLEGINSPHRGWFKLSFGGSIQPYYQVSYG